MGYSQNTEADTTIVSSQKKKEIENTSPKKVKKKKEGFGESLLSLGKGFLDRLKYRFNLEAIEEKVENTKEKLKKKDKKKD